MANDPEKTEKPTPKRLNKSRGEGQVAKSQEVSKVVNILAGFIFLTFWVKFLGIRMMAIFSYFLALPDYSNPTPNQIYQLGLWLAAEIGYMLMPLLLFIGLMIYLVLRVEVGKLWTTKPFAFKWSKFNFISGLKRMFFSAQTFIRLGKSLLQAFFIGIAPMIVVKKELLGMLALYSADPEGVAIFILELAATLVKYALVPMLIIAIGDLWYTRWKYIEDLKMSKSEVKDEHKQQEGDPLVKSKLRQKMMAMGARRMMQQVPKADVVITNPTHIAVALRYDATEAPAPMVLAMGQGRIAEKIKEIAKENRIPIRENVPLARALYKQADVGDTIPPEFFQAVAVILAQLWKNNPPKREVKR